MKLYYYKPKVPNFGDAINAWLWERLLPGMWDNDTREMFCGIGTLIGNNMDPQADWIVFGSGVGYLPPPKDFGSSRWVIECVRGPLSARILGLPAEKAVTDGAIMLALLPEYAPLPDSERNGIGFMPHHQALDAGVWKEICELAGFIYLDPAEDDRKTLEKMRGLKLVVADAMHAAIIADTLRVPWVPVATSPQINSFKWTDWTSSMGLPYRPTRLPPSSRQEAFRNCLLPLMGEAHFLENASAEQLLARFTKQRRLQEQKWWPWRRKPVSAFIQIGGRVIAWLGGRAPDPKAVTALRNAAGMQAYLSDEGTFNARKQRMADLLQEVRAKAASGV